MIRISLLTSLTLAIAACGGGDAPSEGAGEPEAAPPETEDILASVTFVSPVDGDTVPQGPLTVVFEAEGVEIVPAGTMDAGTGHHHLIVDADVASWTEPIGVEEGRYIHLGQGEAEFVVEGLAPGEHRLIAVVADGVHVPLDPPVVDTITITVEGSS